MLLILEKKNSTPQASPTRAPTYPLVTSLITSAIFFLSLFFFLCFECTPREIPYTWGPIIRLYVTPQCCCCCFRLHSLRVGISRLLILCKLPRCCFVTKHNLHDVGERQRENERELATLLPHVYNPVSY